MSAGNLHSTDILVIGAGPAGSCAAKAAADSGLSVIVMDKRRKIGVPIQCAEYIPAALGSFTLYPGVKVQIIHDMLSAYHFSDFERYACHGMMINRARFDQGLAEQAQNAGSRLWMRSYLQALDLDNLTAVIATANGPCTIHYKILIAADGPKSRVASLLGLSALTTINSRQYSVDLKIPSTATKVWLSSQYPGGYAWLFPKGNLANLGVGFVSVTVADLKIQLDILHKILYKDGIVGENIVSRTGGAIPVSGLRKPLALPNLLFVGDAAGLTHPTSGAGIAAAVTSGKMAGQAAAAYITAADTSALLDYAQDIQDLYAVSLERAVKRRGELYPHWQQQGQLSREQLSKSWIASPEYYQT